MKETLESLISRLEFWALIFGAIVVIGVAGESFFGIRIWWNSRKLSAIQREENQRLQGTIANLNNASADALERAGKAEEHLATAHREAAEADKKAEGFRLDIARANERAAEANRVAEQERLARIQLEIKLADRQLSPVQQLSMIERLRAWSGVTVDAIIWGETPEITIIGNQILEVMRRAGWIVQLGHAGGGGGTVRGILVGTNPDANANDIAASAALLSALQSVGLAAGSWKFIEMQQPTIMFNTSFTGKAAIRLFIGSKP